MTRVSENSSFHALNYSVGKGKSKLEDLQIKGGTLKRIQKPSDDPIGNTELLAVRSKDIDSKQYLRNANYAKTQLSYTEAALDEVYNVLVKAKEIAVGQASNIYNDDVRRSIAKEVGQLYEQTISIGNRRLGNRYLFSGHKTLTRPFDENGKYSGDDGQMNLEVAKDVFVPISFNGNTVFFEKEGTQARTMQPLKDALLDQPQTIEPIENKLQNPQLQPEIPPHMQEENQEQVQISRGLASQEMVINKGPSRASIFSDIKSLENALITNNHEIVQALLPRLDDHISRNIEVRAQIGSVINAVEGNEINLEKSKMMNAEYKSKIEDADVAELFADIARQQNVMKATYKSNANLISKNLMDFI
jgi:flagellar hook-associated protein 3 FlgL